MRTSMGRGVGREGGDKGLAANTYPHDAEDEKGRQRREQRREG